MREILEYQVIKAGTSEGVTNLVNNLIEKGWQPIGGVKIITEIEEGLSLNYFFQTMVKYDD